MLDRIRATVTAHDDTGLSLVELMVAIVLFGLASTGIAYGIQAATGSARDSRMRIQAANLASRELEIVRNEFTATATGPTTLGSTSVVANPHPLPGGTAGQPLRIDGSTFTVQRTVQWLPAGSGTSPCDGGALVTYPSLEVNVSVTWPKMGLTKPVVSNTILTPPKGTLNSTLGFVAVKVLGADGRGVENLTVYLTGPQSLTRVTAGDGCAVFPVTSMGAYSAAVNSPGYITFDGQPSATKSVTVTAGSMRQVPFSYDQAATVQATVSTLTGWSLPAPLPPVTLFNSGLPSPYTKKRASTGVTTTVAGLWPFTDGYSVWAGACNQADPAAGQRPASTPLVAGDTKSVDVALAPVTVKVADENELPVAGTEVRAQPLVTTGCTAADLVLTLGTTDANGEVRSSLPSGSYTISVVGRTSDGGWPTTPAYLPPDVEHVQPVAVI